MTSVIVIGGGIAGVSAASALARHHRRPDVHLIEAEATLAHHTTGRSAALLIENYGTPPTRPLTRASLDYLHRPPPDLVDGPLLQSRGVLTVATEAQVPSFEHHLAEGRATNPAIDEITVGEAADRFPALAPRYAARAMWEPDASDIDVAGLHQSFVRSLVAAGGRIDTTCRALRLDRTTDGRWVVETGSGQLRADVIVNAAGAWGDDVARSADVQPVGLTPLRRTAFMVASPTPGSDRWPLMADVDHTWYLKPDGTQFLCSPADESPSEPVDAKPEEIDVAMAIERINAATTLGIRSVTSTWAGLRTFSPDRSMVVGPDPDAPGFVWCVGQGGTGIQTAAGTGQLVADLCFGDRPGPELTAHGVDDAPLRPDRFR